MSLGERRRGAIEVGVSHAVIHRLIGQAAEAGDEVVVVHNVYIVAYTYRDTASVTDW